MDLSQIDFGQLMADGNWKVLATYMTFGLFAGYALGVAVRSFLSVMLFLVGTILLLLFGLQYFGMVDINWQSFSGKFDQFVAWISPHLASFKNFVLLHLSATGAAGVGFLFGVRRR